MDITVETVYQPQVFHDTDQTFHRIVRTTHHPRTQEETFYVIPPVKLDRQIDQLRYGKRRPRQIIAPAIDTVGTIIHAIIGQHDLQ